MAVQNIGGEKQSDIDFTVAAARKVYELLEEENNFDLKLRAYITGGGCSGFQYGFTFDETVQTGDQMVERCFDLSGEQGQGIESETASVTLLVDPMSYQYLKGATIDYTEDMSGEQFVIKNPNAKTTCGCGSSFSIADEG